MNLADAMTIKLDYDLPEYPAFEEGYRRAPRRAATNYQIFVVKLPSHHIYIILPRF